jgi:hypothetical protein
LLFDLSIIPSFHYSIIPIFSAQSADNQSWIFIISQAMKNARCGEFPPGVQSKQIPRGETNSFPGAGMILMDQKGGKNFIAQRGGTLIL